MPGRPTPEDFDFPMSQHFRDLASGKNKSKKPPTIATGEGRVTGTKKVGNITIHITEGAPDEGSFPAISENLIRMGVYPKQEQKTESASTAKQETPTDEKSGSSISSSSDTQLIQQDFLNRTPTSPTKKGREPRKIEPKWSSEQDPERAIRTMTDPRKRKRALTSDAQHDKSVQRIKRRRALGLPDKARPWKELLQEFAALTPEDREILKKELDHRPDLVRNPQSETVELMLMKLKQYKENQV